MNRTNPNFSLFLFCFVFPIDSLALRNDIVQRIREGKKER